MAKLIVTVVTPGRQVVRDEVDQVTAPSVMGEVGILPEHRPLLADLQAGVVTLRRGDKVDIYATSGGFIEVGKNEVTLLLETAERSDEIDIERAQNALKDAEKKLKNLDFGTPDFVEEQARYQRAQVRLQITQSRLN